MTFDWAYRVESLLFPDAAISYAALPPRARGFDTSRWNHPDDKPINFQAAYDAGYRFWAGRLSVGNYYTDPWITRDYEAASLTPIYRMVYHVPRAYLDAPSQVARMVESMRLLRERPHAIVLDVETDGDRGATAVTECLRDHVMAIRDWWNGRLILYTNLNYLTNFIRDTCDLDLWLAWPSDTATNPPDDRWLFWQRSWEMEIPGNPDTTVDLDEFNGDEAALAAYFGAPEPEPEEDMSALDALKIAFEQLSNVSDTIQGILINMNNAIAEAEGQPQPEPPPPPTPPPPAPSNVRNFYIDPADDKPRANARYIKGWNNAEPSRPIFEIYPSDSSTAAERQQFNAGVTVQVEGDIMRGDGGVNCYQLYDPEARYKARPLFIRKDDGYLV